MSYNFFANESSPEFVCFSMYYVLVLKVWQQNNDTVANKTLIQSTLDAIQ